MKTKEILSLTALVSTLILINPQAISQSVPQLINYQGRLTNAAGQPLDGVSVNLTFKFYSAPAGGAVYLRVVQNNVAVSKGIYNVLIGSGPLTAGTENTLAGVFQNHAEVWLGVKVNSDSEMTPRSRITSAGFALKAAKVDAAWLDLYLAVPDYDGDGHLKISLGGNDCNDDDATSYLGAPELCDGKDNQCPGDTGYGTVDEGCGWKKIGNEVRVTYDSALSAYTPPVWTGSEYGVNWTDSRDGNYEIYFARLSATGAKIGSDVRITFDPADSHCSDLMWTGSEFGLVWQDTRGGNYGIYFARISSSGSKLGSDSLVNSVNPNTQYYPSLAWTGSEYGVAWQDRRDDNSYDEIYFARFSATGTKIGSDVRITYAPYYAGGSSLVWTGSEFGLLFGDYRDFGNWEIYFTRISAAGAEIGDEVRFTNAAGDSTTAVGALVWTGSEYGAAWQDNGTGNRLIYFTRISSTGAKIGGDLVVSSTTNSWNPSLVWTGLEYGVGWSDQSGNKEVYFARLSSTGAKLGNDVQISFAPGLSGGSNNRILIWTGSEYGLIWEDLRDGNYEIYFSRVGWAN